jgi:hypothetical protein
VRPPRINNRRTRRRQRGRVDHRHLLTGGQLHLLGDGARVRAAKRDRVDAGGPQRGHLGGDGRAGVTAGFDQLAQTGHGRPRHPAAAAPRA